ncbi:MAG TPA: TA system VapC family ribonuclease toxin [Nocardioidaceae bacterium]|nr:TA system VapC family ribonuclease toxin [Nocardioidaceae bacterium]
MRHLLDVNVLLALLDADHVDHQRTHEWWDAHVGSGWASCALTQNGFVRILSQPRYPSPIPTAQAVALLASACETEHHEFWPCQISILDGDTVDRSRLLGPRQVTDAYLLALAVANKGTFVTYDESVPLSAVKGASSAHLHVL